MRQIYAIGFILARVVEVQWPETRDQAAVLLDQIRARLADGASGEAGSHDPP